jgi:DNA-binding GntR family transcriptional regulator
MSLLEQQGFLRTVPRRGGFIVRKTKKQIIEMIEVWAALESMAARLATLHASDAGHRIAADDVRRVPPFDAGRAHSRDTRTRTSRFTRRSSACRARILMGKTIDDLFIHVRAIRRMTISQRDRAARSIKDHMKDHRRRWKRAIPNWRSVSSASIRSTSRRTSKSIAIFWIRAWTT